MRRQRPFCGIYSLAYHSLQYYIYTYIYTQYILCYFVFSLKLSEMKEIQKMRERPNGVSLVGLALGKNVDLEDDIAVVNNFSHII